jgi:hypothetical protein
VLDLPVWYVLSSMHVCCTYLLENLLSKYYLILLVHDTHFVCAKGMGNSTSLSFFVKNSIV